MGKKVSVIIPVFNAAPYLRGCLDSVLSQTLTDFEAVCVEDGSTDESPAILAEYAAKDARIRVLKGAHAGAGAARNLALEAVCGTYIAFLDADDFYAPDFLATMVETIGGAEIAVCGANYYYGATDERKPAPVYLETARFAAGETLNFTPGNPWNKLFSAELVARHNLRFLSCRHSEDVFFTFPALALASRIVVVDRPLINYRIDNPSSLEHTKGETDCLLFYEAYLQTAQRLRALGVYEKVRASFIRRIARAIVYNLRAPKDVAALRALHTRLRESAVRDFELLQDVPTAFDRELREFLETPFDAYLMSAVATHLWRFGREQARHEREESLRREVAALKGSFAYRCGMVLTAPIRFLVRLINPKRK